jgi:WhiB family redox-sensing transcriptional regulator
MFDAASNQLLATQLVSTAGLSAGDAVNVDELPCHLVDPEVFFAEQPADVEYAKSLCRECPVQEACLAGALDRREPWGVWGGQLLVQGEVVARKRPRGRPRKHPLPEPEISPAVAHRWTRETRGPVRRNEPVRPAARQTRRNGERAA